MGYFKAQPQYYIIPAAGCNKRILQELHPIFVENCCIFCRSGIKTADILCLDKRAAAR